MNSFNHYAYGAVGDWMYRVMAGIDDRSGAAGLQAHRRAPAAGRGAHLREGDASMTPYGEAASGWRLDGDRLVVTAIVPPNTRARCISRARVLEQVREGGAGLASAPGVRRATRAGDTVMVEVGSGSYVFTYDAPALAATLRAPVKR